MPVRIAPGVLQIDTLLGGWDEVTAGYLIEGDAPVLVETGSQSSVPVLLAALADVGLAPGDLAGVAVTHIHLDHAGGVGDVARAFPKATVYVHEKGARHLVDPERLVRSAGLVYGDLLDSLYGRLEPTPAERVHVLADGEAIDVGGGRQLVTVDSPARQHLRPTSSSTRPSARCGASGSAAPPASPSPTTAWCPTPTPSWPRARRP
jgi:glyoxylase-like metal-dependent hydrolase (beta-lactamase superfamily II)